MRAVVQRVRQADVVVEGETISEIPQGFLVLLGVEQGDTEADAIYLAEKIVGLRIFEDADGKMNLSLKDVGGQMLVVSQFTLLGDCRKGRRPSFGRAAGPDDGNRLYEFFAEKVCQLDVEVSTGQFRAMMDVSLVNQGPVTMLLDSRKTF